MRWFVMIAMVGLLLPSMVLSAGDVVSITLPQENVPLKPGQGVDLVAKNCLPCHSLDYITTQPQGTPAQWQATVTKMIKVYGAPIGEEDAKVIAAYLATQYGAGK